MALSNSSNNPSISTGAGISIKPTTAAKAKTSSITQPSSAKSDGDSFVSQSDREAMMFSTPGRDTGKIGNKAVKETAGGSLPKPVNKPFMPLDSAKMFAGIGDAAKAAGQGMEALMKAFQQMKGNQNEADPAKALQNKQGMMDIAQTPPPPPPPAFGFGGGGAAA